MSVRKRVWITRKGETKSAWIVDYSNGAGEREHKTFEKKKEADAFHNEVKVNIRAGTHVAIDNDITIAGVAEKWIKQAEVNGCERGTLRQYEEHVRIHIIPRIGATKLAKLTHQHVEHFRDGLLIGNKAISRPMARKVLVSFKSMLKTVRCGHLAAGVTIGGSVRERRDLEVGVDFPTHDEVRRLIAVAKGGKPLLYALLKVAVMTGLRASELRGLRWADVDLNGHELSVSQRADYLGTIGRPKSKSGIRKIPLGDDLVRTLREWKLACPKEGSLGLVFPTSVGTVNTHPNLLRSLAPLMLKAGLVLKDGSPKYGLHSFRHFFASWCINPRSRGGRELPAKVVQKWMGHSTIGITLDIYGHLFPEGSDRAEISSSERALLG
jgi:integrase